MDFFLNSSTKHNIYVLEKNPYDTHKLHCYTNIISLSLKHEWVPETC